MYIFESPLLFANIVDEHFALWVHSSAVIGHLTMAAGAGLDKVSLFLLPSLQQRTKEKNTT